VFDVLLATPFRKRAKREGKVEQVVWRAMVFVFVFVFASTVSLLSFNAQSADSSVKSAYSQIGAADMPTSQAVDPSSQPRWLSGNSGAWSGRGNCPASISQHP
jgi:hypothetical protein